MAPAERRRLRSVDAFRGLVLAFMVLTPATGEPHHLRALRHAAWDGATASDLVFPTFLVTSGLSLAFLLRPPTGAAVHRRLGRRALLLVLVGLAYNAYGTSGSDLSSLRYTGVLQTIGVAGAVAAVVVLATRAAGRDRPVLLLGAAVLTTGAYWAVVERATCEPAGGCSPWFPLDESVLGAAHTYAGGERGLDPEGIAVTVAASALVLAGYVGGVVIRRADLSVARFAPWLLASGAAALAAALALEAAVPFNKRLLSPSFVLLASGVALVGFAATAAVLDLGDRPRVLERVRAVASAPLVALGRNALVVFLLERLVLQTATMVHVGDRTGQRWLLEELPIAAPGVHLAYTTLVLAAVLVVVGVLHRRRCYLAL